MSELLRQTGGKDMDLGEVFRILSRHSHALLMAFLSLTLCLPISIPVISTALGLALGFVGLLLLINRDVRIPRRLAGKVVPYKRLLQISEKLVRLADRLEKLLRPRMSFVMSGKAMRIHGFFVMLMGFLAAIPLPLPFNNMVAALPVLLLSLSLLQKDGAMAFAAYVATIPCLLYYGTAGYLGYAGLRTFIAFLS
jgi:hypothetical protein